MSETYSPVNDPENITANWIGDLGNSPAAQASYRSPSRGCKLRDRRRRGPEQANCGGVNVTWTSDRPWAAARPFPSGLRLSAKPSRAASTSGRATRPSAVSGSGATPPAGTASLSLAPLARTMCRATTTSATRLAWTRARPRAALTSTVTGRTTLTPVFIPAVTIEGQSLSAGDPAMSGRLNVAAPPSSCAAPKSAPATTGNEIYFYDVFAVTKPDQRARLRVGCPHPTGKRRLLLFGPRALLADVRPRQPEQNYVADDSCLGTLAATLGPGASAQAVIFDDGAFHMCWTTTDDRVRRALRDRSAAAGGRLDRGDPVTTTTGELERRPGVRLQLAAVRRERRRLRPDRRGHRGGLHAHRRRRRLHAAGASDGDAGRAVGFVGLGTDGRDRGSAAADRTARRGTIRLGSRNLAKIVRSGRVPVRVTCDEACSATVQVRVTRSSRRRSDCAGRRSSRRRRAP